MDVRIRVIAITVMGMAFLAVVFCFGDVYGQLTAEPPVVTQIEYVPRYIVERVETTREVEVPREVYPTGFRQFSSQDELSKWQAKHYSELRELGRRNGWDDDRHCVDYAMELQRRAWLEGYQMSVENLLDAGGETGHAICSTWIGDRCIYMEPQGTRNWVGAVKGDAVLRYEPVLVYPESGRMVYREEQ